MAGEMLSTPRVTLLDTDYLRAMTAAELEWVTGVLGDLRSGALTWSPEELRAASRSHLPD